MATTSTRDLAVRSFMLTQLRAIQECELVRVNLTVRRLERLGYIKVLSRNPTIWAVKLTQAGEQFILQGKPGWKCSC